jgi:hypothetical protein
MGRGIGVDIGNLLCDTAGAIGRHFRSLEKKDDLGASRSKRRTRFGVGGRVGERLICSKMSKAVLGWSEAVGGFGRGN